MLNIEYEQVKLTNKGIAETVCVSSLFKHLSISSMYFYFIFPVGRHGWKENVLNIRKQTDTHTHTQTKGEERQSCNQRPG